jgi:hypothetical protein
MRIAVRDSLSASLRPTIRLRAGPRGRDIHPAGMVRSPRHKIC